MDTWHWVAGGPPDGAEEPSGPEFVNWQNSARTSPSVANHCEGPGMRAACDNDSAAEAANEARQSPPSSESRLLLAAQCNKAARNAAREPEVRERKHAPPKGAAEQPQDSLLDSQQASYTPARTANTRPVQSGGGQSRQSSETVTKHQTPVFTGREPASSITSDYFSSPSHSSPVVVVGRRTGEQPAHKGAHKSQTQTGPATIIYENPSFQAGAQPYGAHRMPEPRAASQRHREATKLREQEEARMTRGADKPGALTSLSGARACLGTSVNSNYAPEPAQQSWPQPATTDRAAHSPAPGQPAISAQPRQQAESRGSAASSTTSACSSAASSTGSADRRRARHAKLASAAVAFASLELAADNSTTTAPHYKSPHQDSACKPPDRLAASTHLQQQQVAVDSQLLLALAAGAPTSMHPLPPSAALGATLGTNNNNNNRPHQHLYGRIPAALEVQAPAYGYATSDLSSSAATVGGEPHDYSSDYHYYQVVVPAQVSSNQQPQHKPHTTVHDTRTLQANLVNSEPLIGSCSWRNKTLINLNSRPSAANYYYGPPAPAQLDTGQPQPRYAPFSPVVPIELASIQHQHHLAAYCNQNNNSLLATQPTDKHRAGGGGPQMSADRSFALKRVPFGFLSARLFLLLLLLAASCALFLVALLSNKLSVNKVHETAGPISPNEPYMHRQLMGLAGPPVLVQAPHSGLPPPGGQSSFGVGEQASSTAAAAATGTALGHQFQPARMNTPAPRASGPVDTPAQSTGPSYVQLPAPTYWHRQAGDDAGAQCNPSSQSACNLQGLCISGVCRCFAGYSGPTCARVDCAEDCSQRGACQLRTDKPINQLLPGSAGSVLGRSSSLGFSSLTSGAHLSSVCPAHSGARVVDNSSLVDAPADTSQQPRTYDHRLEWHCSCHRGFAGPKCERLEELDCANGRDDDRDGLVDCDDDDCCSQPACSQIFVCYTSPEPQLVLDQLAASSSPWWAASPGLASLPAAPDNNNNKRHPTAANGEAFYAQMRFLIANKSMQSYVHESAFEASRVAVIRGRVVKWSTPEGIVSVRVAVLESERLGFTLTRHDGSFDLLVNGNEWLTLELHKNAYTPLKHRIFVRPLTINQLDQELVMWLAGSPGQQHLRPAPGQRADFGSSVLAELHQLAWSVSAKDDPRRTSLLQCLLNVALRSPDTADLHLDMAQARPRFVGGGVLADTDFVLVSAGASYETGLKLPLQTPIELAYNSAMFPPAASLVKSHVVLQLLDHQKPLAGSLSAILVQFHVEGQMKSERLQPIVGLTYQFAWNRRNIYQQKVYGFAQLIVRVGYEFTSSAAAAAANANATYPLWLTCLAAHQQHQHHQMESSAADWAARSAAESLLAGLERRTVWFERRLHLEAHQLNHHADLAKWQLPAYNRLDPDRQLIYFGAGWSLPFRWAYPPVVGEPVGLAPALDTGAHRTTGTARWAAMTHGPPDSMFMILQGRLVQLDVSRAGPYRRLIDVPLATLSTKLGLLQNPQAAAAANADDELQLIYNNHQSMLYVSSRSAAKIVQVSLSSLLVLNRTQAGQSPTSAPEDEIDIEPLCGFGRHPLALEGEPVRLARSVRLTGPHALTLDEQRQILYFIDGASSLMALELQTRRLSLVPALVPQANPRQHLKSPAAGPCDHLPIHWTHFSPVKLSGLKWARAQSGLVFIDQNTVFILGQDMFVRVLAAGWGSPHALAPAYPGCVKQPELGEIKMLLVDDTTDNLFVIHRWQARTHHTLDRTKLDGRLYLARLKLGIPQSAWQPHTLLDLHSARSAWDPTIKQLAMAPNKTTINWHEISSLSPAQLIAHRHQSQANRSQQVNSSGQSTTRTKIPFIHLQNGFERIDSIEINSDGSIFVLDYNANSIRKIAPYSPNEFNLIERHDVNINRLFVTNPEPTQYYSSLNGPPPPTGQPVYYSNQTKGPSEESEAHKLNVLIIQNPINGEMLEFHAASGLQLASFTTTFSTLVGSEQQQQQQDTLPAPANGRLEFYYKVFSPTSRMTEDDANDFQAIKLAQNYKLLDFYDPNQQQNRRTHIKLANHLGPTYVRLNKVSDISHGDVYELQRFDKEPGFVLQSILLNDQPICELTADFMGVLISIQLLHQDFRTELVYHGTVYLLTEMATKSSQQLQNLGQSIDSTDQAALQPTTKVSRQLKKIAYDNLFYHYCNLIIANL